MALPTTEILVTQDSKMTVVVDNGKYPKPLNPTLLIPVGCQQQPNGHEVLVIQKTSETTAVPLVIMPKLSKAVVYHEDHATSSVTGTNSIMVSPPVLTAPPVLTEPPVFDNAFSPNSCAYSSLGQSEDRTMSLVDTKPAQIELSNSGLDTDRLWTDNRHSSASTRSLDLDVKIESPDDLKDDSPPVELRLEPVERMVNSDGNGGDSEDDDSSTNATAGGEMLNDISFGSSSSPTGVSAEQLLAVEMRDSPVPLPVDVSATTTSTISSPVSLVTQSNQQLVAISGTIPVFSMDSSPLNRLGATEIRGHNGSSLLLNPIDLRGDSSNLVEKQQANGVLIKPRATTKSTTVSVPVQLVLVKPGTPGSPAQIVLVQQPQQINETNIQQSSAVNSPESEFEKERECLKCGAVFRTKAGLKRHMSACLSGKQLTCPGCNHNSLKTSSGLASHMRHCIAAKKLLPAQKEQSEWNGKCTACDGSCEADFDAKRKKQGIPLGKIKATGTYFPPAKAKLPPVQRQFQLRDNFRKHWRNPNRSFRTEALSAAQETIARCSQQTPNSSAGSAIQTETLPTTEHTYSRAKPKLASVKINGTFFPPCDATIPSQQKLNPPEHLKTNHIVSDAQNSIVSNLSNEKQPNVELERNVSSGSANSTALTSSEPPAPTPSIEETSDERLFNFNTTIICNNSKSKKDSNVAPNLPSSVASNSMIDSPANATSATPRHRAKRTVNGRKKAVNQEWLKKRNNISPQITRQMNFKDKHLKACSIWNFETPYRKATKNGKEWQQKAAWHCAQSLVKRGKGSQLAACQLLLETLAEFGLKGKLTADPQLTEKLISSLLNGALTKDSNGNTKTL